MEWKEAQPPRGDPGPIYGFRRGYKTREAGRHESADQYHAFQQFLRLDGIRSFAELSRLSGHKLETLTRWADRFNWEKRAVAWQRDQMAITWREADKLKRDAHRTAITEFRNASERQARMMSRVSEDLVRILGKRIAKAEQNNEEIPMSQVSGLLRAASSLGEQARQSWGNALGVTELLDVVEAEVEKVRIEEVEVGDPYDFEIEE